MKREFRGRSYRVECNIPILLIRELVDKKKQNQNYNFSEEEIIFWREMKLDIALEAVEVNKEKDVVEAIRDTFLQQYNEKVTDTMLLHYLFVKKYIKYVKRKKSYDDGDVNQILNLIKHDMKKYGGEEWREKNCKILLENCVFLGLINSEEFKVDNTFINRWMYYPVKKMFIDTIDDLKGVKDSTDYLELKPREYELFSLLLKGELHIGDIKNISIKKDGKVREVCIADSATDKLIVNYLAKRLRETFNITFPDRDRIMEIVVNLIDSLPRLQDYTIYRFDFKDFFKNLPAEYIYDEYIRESGMSRSEKKLLLELINKTSSYGCAQGLATSNVLVEIIAKAFDNAIITKFDEFGLVLYKRYVDDGILIFNRRVGKKEIRSILQEKIDMVFNSDKYDGKSTKKNVVLSEEKERYQTRYTGDDQFDYLGYSFLLERKEQEAHYKYGIALNKLEKYKMQLEKIYEDYAISGNIRLLYHRLRFFNSRIVYYDYSGYKYKHCKKWDVRGIVNNYRMLRKFIIISDKKNRIIEETEVFLKDFHVELLKNMYIKHRFRIPDFLKGKGIENYTLWTAFKRKHSIVFQANIGWNIQYLREAIIDITGSSSHGSYTELVKQYSELVMIEK